jgi:phosphatidylinositol-3-phosphatase
MNRLRWGAFPATPLLLAFCLAALVGPVIAANGVPTAEHVIVVVMENKFYQDVWGEPYTASLIASGSLFTQSYAITHPSQPNYIALWSGSTQGVTDDACPPAGAPYATANLGQACEAAGISWKSYCENLPAPAFSGCASSDLLYVRKHAPCTHFNNLNHQRERPFQDLATDIASGTLPRVSFVIPNQCNNTHDCSVEVGDAWLAANIPAMIQAAGPNGFVILTWDEDDSNHGNHILTIFAGGLVKSGYVSARRIDHYTVLRTICEALGIAPLGMAASRTPITDVWVPTAEVEDAWGAALSVEVRPNPSSGAFDVQVTGVTDERLDAAVCDASGRRVVSLLRGPRTGEARLHWDGKDDDGRSVAAGPYFLRISSGDRHATEKLILLR